MSDLSFEPMPGRVLIEPMEEEQTSSSGLIILSQGTGLSHVMGTIRAIGGDEAEGDDYPLEEGDVVLYSRNAGVRIQVNRREHIFLRTTEVISKVRGVGERAPAQELGEEPL